MATITDLPAEIVAQIARSIRGPRSSLPSLRLVCRRLCDQSTPVFLSTFYSSITLNFCTASLQRLRRIAYDDVLRTQVRQITFCEHENRHPIPSHPTFHLPQHPCSPSTPPSANTFFTDFVTNLTRLPNLVRVGVRDDGKPHPAPHEIPTDCLCLIPTNTIHLVLIALSRSAIPLKSFGMWHGSRGHMGSGPLLPDDVAPSLSPTWSTHLIDLALEWSKRQTHLTAPLVQLVTHATSLRSLQLADAPTELLLDLDKAIEPGQIRLERLEVANSAWDMRTEHFLTLINKFQDTLEYLLLASVRLDDGTSWKGVIADWAVSLKRLKGVGFWRLQHVLTRPGSGKTLAFGCVLEWDEAPEGKAEFSLKGSDVIGFKYVGEHVGKVLGRIASASKEATLMGDPDGTAKERFGNEIVVGGRLRARRVKLAPKLSDILGENMSRVWHRY
ncbi:hypothetical protein OQA88_10549 [Cercophora sp. LCS_1]